MDFAASLISNMRKLPSLYQSDQVFLTEPRWWLWLRVSHADDRSCKLSNLLDTSHCWEVCGILGEMLSHWKLSEESSKTLNLLLRTLWSLPYFNDEYNRSFWPSDVDLELESPTFNAGDLLRALEEIQIKRAQLGDPEWSFVYECELPEANFVSSWTELIKAHGDCSNVLELRAVLGG